MKQFKMLPREKKTTEQEWSISHSGLNPKKHDKKKTAQTRNLII